MTDPKKQITELLARYQAGDRGAFDRLVEAVHEDLVRLARTILDQHVHPGGPGHTLESAALVNMAYMKFLEKQPACHDREAFFRLYKRGLRFTLLNYIESRLAQIRGGDWKRVPLFDLPIESGASDSDDLLRLRSAVSDLIETGTIQAEATVLRYFCRLPNREVAEMLDIGLTTAEDYIRFGRAWLLDRINKKDPER